MTDRLQGRLAVSAPLLVSGLLLAGCMGSPTYGTGKSANEQLFEDVTGVLSISPKRGPEIAYKPRPDLVKPASAEALPAPQENIVTASSGEVWPESPEARRKRLRDEATANQDNSSYESPIVRDVALAESRNRTPTSKTFDRSYFEGGINNQDQQRAAFNKKLAESKQGSATSRRYLSEPPTAYRAPEASAPVGDIGEDEWKKERRLKRENRKKGSWRDMLPW